MHWTTGALAHSHTLPRHSPAQTSAPVDIAGIKYPISATVGSGNLQLNGAGIRYKFVVKVCTAMGTLNMSEIFAAMKRLMAGDSFFVDYVPGAGATVSINGKVAGEPIKEPGVFTVLMKIWLGNSPADCQLKDALLRRTKG